MRILVAEDSLTQATLLRMALQRKGHEILLARDGIEAIRMVWEHAPEIVVSDVEMPRLKGYQVCRLLRDDPATATIPVVLLTSLDRRQDAFWGLKSGADKYITKVGDIAAIAEEIHAFAAARPVPGNGGPPRPAGRAVQDADVMERIVQLLDRNLFESTVGSEIQNLVHTLDDQRATVRGVLGILRGVVDFHAAAVHLGGEDDAHALSIVVARPVAAGFLDELRRRVLAETGAPEPLPEEVEVEDPEGLLGSPGAHPAQPGTVLVAPLTTKGRASGAIAVAAAEDAAYPEKVIQTFEMIARQANIVIDYARLYERTKQLSITDGLTKLYNHRFFQDALRREWARSGRHGTALSLVLLDIDRFKTFNDTYGHQQGDAVLRELARVLRGQVRSLDVVARYGGEEFAVVMPDADAGIALGVAERLRAAVEGHPVPGPAGPLTVTISLGVATAPQAPIDSPTALIAAADRALYRAKERGRNRVEGTE